MALTEAQKLDLRMYLGWSDRFHQFDSELEQAISAMESRAATETKVLALLDECVRVDGLIQGAEGRLKASEVGSITLNPAEIDRLRERGRTAVKRIATILGVDVREDAFSPALPRNRASRFGMVGGGNRQLSG